MKMDRDTARAYADAGIMPVAEYVARYAKESGAEIVSAAVITGGLMKSDEPTPETEASQPKGEAMSMMTVERAAAALIEPSEMPDAVEQTELEQPVNMQLLEQSLSELIQRVKEGEQIPALGRDMAKRINECFEQTAAYVENLAQDHVDRALVAQRDAMHFAEVVRQSGMRFCRLIESETTRGSKIATLMSEARKIIADSAS